MLLKNLLPKESGFEIINSNLDQKISSIEIDSRKVKQNSIFFAFDGKQNKGLDFIPYAIKNGAKIVVCHEKENPEIQNGIIFIKAKNPHDLLVFMLQKFYAKLPENIFAITGTNGKTSTADFCRQMLEIFGKKAAVIGTLGVTTYDLTLK